MTFGPQFSVWGTTELWVGEVGELSCPVLSHCQNFPYNTVLALIIQTVKNNYLYSRSALNRKQINLHTCLFECNWKEMETNKTRQQSMFSFVVKMPPQLSVLPHPSLSTKWKIIAAVKLNSISHTLELLP